MNHYRDELEPEFLEWNTTHTVSDMLGPRHVTVWQNSYDGSDPDRKWGWEVRLGTQKLWGPGGVGLEKLQGYSDTLKAAKTDGAKAMIGANRADELEAEEKKKLVDMISQPMMKKDTDDS
jgi:hypothetical protein